MGCAATRLSLVRQAVAIFNVKLTNRKQCNRKKQKQQSTPNKTNGVQERERNTSLVCEATLSDSSDLVIITSLLTTD
jgi:hypothetical protein